MFLENEKIRLVLANTYNLGGENNKKFEESSFIIELPTKDENLIVPNGALEFQLWEIHEGQESYKCLIRRIFIGEVSTIDELANNNKKFLYSRGLNPKDLNNFKNTTPCVVYKTSDNNYEILAQAYDTDIVLNNVEELKQLVSLLSNEFYEVKSSVKRVRNIKNNFKRL